MNRFKLLGAMAWVSAAVATPALAQAALQEPGAFAFYHPNGDLGIGSAPPATDAMASLGNSVGMARMRHATMSHPMVARRVPSAKAY